METDKENKITAIDIKKSLSEYCSKDFFITECKNGSTWFPPSQGLLKFDALSIKKSWTRPLITIYEVKVSRSDFNQDPKFHLYRQYCNEFYFAAPKGMIAKNEVPDWAGLIEYIPENKTLRKKKKALYQDITYDADMLMYIIMNGISGDRIPFYGNNRMEFAKDYLENKKQCRYIGEVLGSKLSKEAQDMRLRLDAMEGSEYKVKEYDRIEEFLDSMGMYVSRYSGGDSALSDKIMELLDNKKCPVEIKEIKQEAELLLHYIENKEKKYENQ